MGGGDAGGVGEVFFLLEPGCHGLEHAAHQELVIQGEAALDGEVLDEALDELGHDVGARRLA